MLLDSTRVALLAQASYAQPSLDRAVDRLLAACAACGSLRSARVLLKPNLITARNGQLACTDGRLLAAAARWFIDQGAWVQVGDSPSFGSARAVLTKIGAIDELTRLGAEVVEFHQSVRTDLPGGLQAPLAVPALDCDLLVNLPRVKAHQQMRVTLAVKNYFGCVSGFHKPWWHMRHGGDKPRFPALLVALLAVLPDGLSLVDGVVAMHESGPVHGEPYPLGLLACATNPVAVDTALLAVLGVDPELSPLWREARRVGLPGTRLDELHFPEAAPSELAVRDFVVPATLNPIRFNPFRFAKNSLRRLVLRLTGN